MAPISHSSSTISLIINHLSSSTRSSKTNQISHHQSDQPSTIIGQTPSIISVVINQISHHHSYQASSTSSVIINCTAHHQPYIIMNLTSHHQPGTVFKRDQTSTESPFTRLLRQSYVSAPIYHINLHQPAQLMITRDRPYQ